MPWPLGHVASGLHPLSVRVNVRAHLGAHQDARACMCVHWGVCAGAHVSLIPGSWSEACPACRKTEANLEDGHMGFESAKPPFPPTPPPQPRYVMDRFYTPTWTGVPTGACWGRCSSFARAARRQVARRSFLFCIPFRLNCARGFLKTHLCLFFPKVFWKSRAALRVSDRYSACVHRVR